MEFASHVSHYFEKEAGPLLSICDLAPEQRRAIIDREKDAETGFNRFSYGEEFFDFRLLADDLLLDLYEGKFGRRPERRPFYGVLGDADVVGGLFRDPHKMRIPVEAFGEGELTFMCPDHFHLVSLMKRDGGGRMFGYQIPNDYSEEAYPYFGKLMTYEELVEGFEALKIDRHLMKEMESNGWYRYVEAQIWADPEVLRREFGSSVGVVPEPWKLHGVTQGSRSVGSAKETTPLDTAGLPEAPSSLSYGGVTIAFCRMTEGDESRGFAPGYHFTIFNARSEEVGHLNFRVGDSEHIRLAAGHIGFEVTEQHRGNGYAALACFAVAPWVAKVSGAVIITVDPDNIPSIRTIERIGAVFLDEVDVPVGDPHYERGSFRKKRYRWVPKKQE